MTRILVLVLLATLTTLGMETPPDDNPAIATFNKDVFPILENNCQSCHRPGGIGPMSLMTYENARPWARAIKAKVLNKQMPPWFAESGTAPFRNAPQLTVADIGTLAAWADSGAREGNTDRPHQTRQWTDGWRTQPDVIVSMDDAYAVSATGPGEIRHFFIPSPFTEDTWVTSIEIRPGDPSVVHHAIVELRDTMPPRPALPKTIRMPDGSEVPIDVTVVADVSSPNAGGYYAGLFPSGPGTFTTMEAVYAPGTQPLNFAYTNSAKLIPGGKPIRLEVHYTPNGKPTSDKTMVGFTLAEAPAQRRFVIMAPEHLADARKPIPAGAANYETRGELKFKQDVDLAWFMPHMHLRGKDMTFQLIYPNGQKELVLSAKFNFHWQLGYELEKPIHVPKGTRLIVTAHHDNSRNNPLNPDASKPVDWGDLTSQEMMVPWFGVIVDGDPKPESVASYKQKGTIPTGGSIIE